MKVKLILILATCALAACVPRGGNYNIGNNSTEPAQSREAPVIVPERTIIADTPSWSPAIVERNAQMATAGDYTVQPGDTLYRIEAKTGAGLAQIVLTNDLAYPYIVRVGQPLKIPGGLYHRVSEGETGIAIARTYGLPWAEIVGLNSLQHPYILRQGQRLRLPETALATAAAEDMTPEKRAAAFSLNIDDIVTGGEPATAIVVADRPRAFSEKFGWPLSGAVISRFGSNGGGRVNDGINIGASDGSAVSAAADGIVVYSGNEIVVFGGLVLIDHGGGWVTAYGHLGRLDVKRGDRVATGQSLGAVGSTGYVSQPKLHFEIRKDRKPLDPLIKLSAL